MTGQLANHGLMLLNFAAQLGLCGVALTHLHRSPVAVPLAWLGLVAFTFNFAYWAHGVTGDVRWAYLDWSTSPMTLALGLHFVLLFVGKRRRHASALYAAYAACGSVSLVSSTAFFSDWGRAFVTGPAWELAMMLILPPLLVFDVFLLLRNLREQPLALERIRTRLVIAGWVSCFALAVAEILTRSVVALPATLIPSVLLTLAVFRFRLLDDAMPLAAIHTVALLIIAVASGAIAVSLLSFNWALVAIALMLILVTLYVLVSHTLEELLRRRQQIDRLAVLGRMLSQLAHDIKNPLAAMKGAAQFLKEERAQGRSIDDQSAFLDMIIAESDRLTRLVDRYQRLRKLEPVCRPANVNEVVQQVVARQALQVDGNHARVELHPHLPECQVDPDLLDTALQNLLTNSIEASSAADEPVLIRTEPLGRESRPHGVAITIEDHGLGMNPRDMEQAFDEFFTTKAQGSGLGLPLVRGVVDAHGGKLQVRSGLGEGTSVRIELPLRTELPSNTEAT